MKVRIVEPALGGYTGMLYQISFTDGVSDRELTAQEVSVLGAAMRVESLDGEQVGAAVDHIRAKQMTLNNAVEKNAKFVEDVTKKTEAEKATPAAAKTRYTRKELEAIADDQGISGLRELAEPLGIKGRSINELIGEILALQGE